MSAAGIAERLAAGGEIIIDGANGSELERRGVPMDERAWCGPSVTTHSQVLKEIHKDYIAAGAEVIITNTFASSRQMLEPAGYGDQVAAMNTKAVEIAKIPEQIRGFDMIKQRNVEYAKSSEKEFLKQFRNSLENTTGQKHSEVVS